MIPEPEAVQEALKHPNGWIYIINPEFKDKDEFPPESIKGAWKVNENGIIIGEFIPNPNYSE